MKDDLEDSQVNAKRERGERTGKSTRPGKGEEERRGGKARLGVIDIYFSEG